MRYVEAGGARLSVIGLGTWQFGSREWAYGASYAERDALEITARALDLGINLIDTAEIYAFGKSERIVGRAIRGRRDDAFIATKILPVLPIAQIVERRARASAARLGVDKIDLYQLHWPNPVVPLTNTMSAMRSLQASGLVGSAGVSNYSLSRWQQAEAALGGPVLSNQVQYSLLKTSPRREMLGWAQEHGRLVIAYSPVAQGVLSGRYDAGNKPPGMRTHSTLFLDENLARVSPLIDLLREIAKGHDATPAQIALAWVIHDDNVVAIPGASSVAQVEANAVAADIALSEEEHRRLTDAAGALELVTGPGAVPLKVKSRLARA